MITKPRNAKRWPGLAAVVFAVLGAIMFTEAQSGKSGNAADPGKPSASGEPRIVATSPVIGANDVDPSLKEITVTFDRDMAGGFSWTGSGPEYPGSGKPAWKDKRTCALPVKLDSGHYYRVGINSQSH